MHKNKTQKSKLKIETAILAGLLMIVVISVAFVYLNRNEAISGFASKMMSSTTKVTGVYMNPKTNYLATVIKSEGKKTLITSPTNSNVATTGSLTVYYPEATKPITVMLPNGEQKTVIGGTKNKKGEPIGGAEVKQDKNGKIISVKDNKGFLISQEKDKDKVVILDSTSSFYVGAGLNEKEIKDYSNLYFTGKEAKEWAEVVAAPSGFFNKLGTLTKSSGSKSKINSLTIEKKGMGLAQEFSAKGATTKEKTFLEKMMGYRKGIDAAAQTQDPDCFCSQGSEGGSFVDAALGMNPAEGGDLSSATNPGNGCGGGQTGGDSTPSGSMMGSGGLGNLGTGASGKSAGKQSGSSSSSKSSDTGCECASKTSNGGSKGELCKEAAASAAVQMTADCIDQGKSTTVTQTGSPEADASTNPEEPMSAGGTSDDGLTAVEVNYPNGPNAPGEVKVYQQGTSNTGEKTWVQTNSGGTGAWPDDPYSKVEQVEITAGIVEVSQTPDGAWIDPVTIGGAPVKELLATKKIGLIEKKYGGGSPSGKKVSPDMGSGEEKKGAKDAKIKNAATEKSQQNIIEFKTGGSGDTGGQCDPDKGPCTQSGSGSGGLGGMMVPGGDPCGTPQITGSLCENSWAYGKMVGMKDPSPIDTGSLTNLVSIGIDEDNGITCFKGSGIDPKEMVIITASNGGVIMPMTTAKDMASQTGSGK